MLLKERISAFAQLGEVIRSIGEEEFEELSRRIKGNNNWFTKEDVKSAFDGILLFLKEEILEGWLEPYALREPASPKKVGILMAGNIPAVGFHDLLCVLLSGHEAHVKLSSSDSVSIPWLVGKLLAIEPRFESKVFFEEMLKGKDAYIATGSDNSARYFDYYFGKYPSIIRKNRTSVGILRGDESELDFQALGRDVFQYFGLGCRNVSKIFVPNKKLVLDFLDAIMGFGNIAGHHKYFNNYEYNKSIYLVNKEEHFDNGFLLMKESVDLVSPIGVLFFEVYEGDGALAKRLEGLKEKIQCVVSKNAWYPGSFSFGEAQCPAVSDYADNVDTIDFLSALG